MLLNHKGKPVTLSAIYSIEQQVILSAKMQGQERYIASILSQIKRIDSITHTKLRDLTPYLKGYCRNATQANVIAWWNIQKREHRRIKMHRSVYRPLRPVLLRPPQASAIEFLSGGKRPERLFPLVKKSKSKPTFNGYNKRLHYLTYLPGGDPSQYVWIHPLRPPKKTEVQP